MTADAAPREGSGFRAILVSTAIAGVAGYLIQGLAGWALEPDEYAAFGVFWATFYLFVGAVAGIQQEIARTARPERVREGHSHHRRLFAFTGIAAAIVAGLIAASAPLWAAGVFGDRWLSASAALVVGATAYVAFATFSGVLYGRAAWRLLAFVIIADPVLRLVFVSLALTLDIPNMLDWAIVLPIPVTLVAGVIVLAWRRARHTAVGERVPTLLSNAGRTLLGSAAMAVLISALPLFVAVSAHDEETAEVGALIFNLTITRAPLVIPILAFQGWLVIHFRDGSPGWLRRFWLLLGGIAVAGVALAVIAWFAVPPLVGWLFGPEYALDSWLAAGIVLTASLTAALCASGAVVIARGGHTAYLIGWAIAAASAIVALFLPIDLAARVVLALAIGPALGLGVHMADLVRRSANEHRDRTRSTGDVSGGARAEGVIGRPPRPEREPRPEVG